MGNTNYFSGIVKILENPKQRLITKKTKLLTFRVELPQNRNHRIVSLVFWGKLGCKMKDFYKLNDYILIEGYVSLRNKRKFKLSKRNSKQVTITVSKVYPILLNMNKNVSSIKK
jgi:hypothetical protein